MGEKLYIIAITKNGYGIKFELDELRLQCRGGKGVRGMLTSDKSGPVVASQIYTDNEEIVIITEDGKVLRLLVDNIRSQGRGGQGMKLMNVDPTDAVVAIC